MTIPENKVLFETLESMGINDIQESKIECIQYGLDKSSRNKVHLETNNILDQCIKKDEQGDCIHITGEMRALTDPFHRFLCDKINKKDKDVFKVIYKQPEEYLDDHIKIVEWNLQNWNLKDKKWKWIEQLRTIYSIADRSVNLYSYDTSNEVQYSVFGNKYILFHEKHQDKAKSKKTWLLESDTLNSVLTTKAEHMIRESKNLYEGNYRKFTQNLNNFSSERFYNMLRQKKKVHSEILLEDEIANDFSDSTSEILEALRVMQFVKVNSFNEVSLTEGGHEFFKNSL